jgi:hypothetical protein
MYVCIYVCMCGMYDMYVCMYVCVSDGSREVRAVVSTMMMRHVHAFFWPESIICVCVCMYVCVYVWYV